MIYAYIFLVSFIERDIKTPLNLTTLRVVISLVSVFKSLLHQV